MKLKLVFVAVFVAAFAAAAVAESARCEHPDAVFDLNKVAGTVVDPSGAPVSGAMVAVVPLVKDSVDTLSGRTRTVYRTGDRPAAAMLTDSTGHFQFAGLKSGRYEVHVDADGFRFAYNRVTVSDEAGPAELKVQVAGDDSNQCEERWTALNEKDALAH